MSETKAEREERKEDEKQEAREDAKEARQEAKEAAKNTQKPSMGRIVIYRDASGNCAPAIVTRVYEDGSLALHAFRDDAAGGPTFDTLGEVKADSEDAGWFWPPRV